jgi:hypothetical protein
MDGLREPQIDNSQNYQEFDDEEDDGFDDDKSVLSDISNEVEYFKSKQNY